MKHSSKLWKMDIAYKRLISENVAVSQLHSPSVSFNIAIDLREHIFSLKSWCSKLSDNLCLMLKLKCKEVAEEAQLQVVANGH